MSLSLYATYLVFVILLVIAPGPDTMVVLKNSLAGGRTAGMLACLGVSAGNLVQGTAVALGVGALIVRSQPVFDGLRIAGVVYLCWLGFQALVNMGTVTDTLPATGVPLPFISSGGTALAITLAGMGVLMNVAAHGTGDEGTNRRRIDATADLGRRNWRAPFAGARRRPGVARRAP